GDMTGYAQTFGAVQNRKYDMGTQVALAVLQGANNFKCVRVTDGTDVAASVVVQTNCITFTSKYTGTLGNGIQVTLSTGSAASSWRAVV
ncbi:phage tail protein, partial [Salmonella enterica]